jgi:hypothetical protein
MVTLGDSTSSCVGDRKKSLCCDAPNGQNPYLPVALDKIFPKLPPKKNVVKFDVQVLGSAAETQRTQPFGFVLISGPASVVSNLNKRDGSHMTFLSCEDITTAEKQTTRLVCMDDSEDSNCDDILLDGIEGTIIKMPENCGPGTYAVAHSLETSANQEAADHILAGKPFRRSIMDLTFHYDFSLVKRADEPVYLRVDYSNVYDYWKTIVDSDGEKRKRTTPAPRSPLEKRFFSGNVVSWASRFDDLTSANTGDFTEFKGDMAESIVGKDKACSGSQQFLEMHTSGSVSARAKWGYSFVGTIQPFNIDEAYGFLDVDFDMDVSLQIKASTGLDIDYTTENLWPIPIRLKEFHHPGIVSFTPEFQVKVGMKADNAAISG